MEVLLKLPNSDSLQKETVRDFHNQSSSGSKRSSMERNDIELRSTRSEMMEMKEENERLKAMLEKIETDYKSLKLRFSDTMLHRSDNLKNPIKIIQKLDEIFDRERDLVSLSLGRGGSSSPTNGKKGDDKMGKSGEKDELAMAGLTLGFGRHDHAGFSLEGKKDEKDEVGSGEERLVEERKVEKRMMGDGEEVGNQQSHVKRARVCVRARCDTPTMNDGCQWRKYGQKISKGNPCPRAYYRCTVGSGCPVRKQVQRCIDDMSILITTYEGSHNHPLPIAATAMASTTTAAATMLLSGSSTTSSQSTPAAVVGTNTNGSSKFNLYSNPTTTTTFSPLHQTVTLDLTAPPHLSSSRTTSLDFSKFSTVGSIQQSFPSTSFDFSSSAIDASPSVWGRGNPKQSNLLPYGQVRFGSSLFLEKQAVQDDQSFTETLIKTIASDPSFRSAIATAINSAKAGSRNGEEDASAQPNPSNYLPFSVPKKS